MANIVSGEDKAWEALSRSSSEEVCKKAGAIIEHNSIGYNMKSFGQVFFIDPENKELTSIGREGDIFLNRLSYFFRPSVLWYLVKAIDIKPSGKLMKPSSMPGGDIFFRGSHVLPLDGVAKKYAKDREGFLTKGISMGGKEVKYGNAAVELYPFPKIPVTLILWLEDEEWPARVDLLLDSTAPLQMPIDILWSVAMMSVLIFL